MNYYCKKGAFGVQHLNITIVFDKCPDIYFQWRKQCGNQASSSQFVSSGLNLDLMIGSGAQRFSLIQNGVKMFSRAASQSQGSLQTPGLNVEQRAVKQLTNAQAKQFLRSHNHQEMSFLIHNSQRKRLVIQNISVKFMHQAHKGQITGSKARQSDIMMPTVYGPAIQQNLNLLKGQDIPFILDFNCIGQKVGEGWVVLAIQLKYSSPIQVEFFHRCHSKQSFLSTIEQTIINDAILLGDVLLYLTTALVFLFTLYVVIYVCCMSQGDQNIVKKAKTKFSRSIEILVLKARRIIRQYFNMNSSQENQNCGSDESDGMGEQMALIKSNGKLKKKRKPMNPSNNNKQQTELEDLGFVLQEQEHLSIDQTIKNYGSLN